MRAHHWRTSILHIKAESERVGFTCGHPSSIRTWWYPKIASSSVSHRGLIEACSVFLKAGLENAY